MPPVRERTRSTLFYRTRTPEPSVFSELLAKIRFQTGLQLAITDLQIISAVVGFYYGLYQGRNTIPLNSYINRGTNVNYIPYYD